MPATRNVNLDSVTWDVQWETGGVEMPVHWMLPEGREKMVSGFLHVEEGREGLRFPVEFPYDECIFVLEGEAEIEIPGGELVKATKGELIAFDKGEQTTWTITQTPYSDAFVGCP